MGPLTVGVTKEVGCKMNHQKSWKNSCSMTLKFASGCKKKGNKLIHQLLCSVYNQQKLDSHRAELLKKKSDMIIKI